MVVIAGASYTLDALITILHAAAHMHVNQRSTMHLLSIYVYPVTVWFKVVGTLLLMQLLTKTSCSGNTFVRVGGACV